jgi:hypothetical protein
MEWVNSDGTPAANPAKTVITKTSSGASWYGASGNSSNGLGTPHVPTSSPYGGSSSGDKYEAKDGSSGLIQYDVTVNASVSVEGAVGGYSYGVSTGVSATPYPVTVYLVGSIPQNGVENALIGQGITGNLNTPPFTASAQTGHAWSVGGDTFQSWTVKPDQTKATLVIGSGLLNQPTFHCYWKDETTTTVSCTATFSTPSGPLSVTGEQKLRVWMPYYFYGYNVGSVGASTTSVFTQGPGMKFTGAVGTPTFFQPLGVGKWTFVQLVTFLYQEWSPISPVPGTLTTGSDFQLDNIWPYPFDDPPYYPANSVTPTPPQTGPNPAYLHSTEDSPEYDFDSWARYVKGKGQWEMYMMYLPPGFDVQWVPLAKLYWQWDFNMSWGGSGWIPTSPGSVTAPSGVAHTTIHPQWYSRHVNN